MYKDGRGVTKNNALAYVWFRTAAYIGEPEAQLRVGLMYAEGTGIRRNYIAAYKWLYLSAESEAELPFFTKLFNEDSRAKDALKILTKNMTAGDIFKAQRLARKWHANADVRHREWLKKSSANAYP